jgi:hypothetical protein
MSEPKKFYCGDPPAERERQRIEAEDLNRRVNWVRSRRMQYQHESDYKSDMRRATSGWDDIKGPDGKGAER